MRRLFILRGSACSGKTTWVHENNLSGYTVSIEEVRRLCSSPVYNIDGSRSVPESRPEVAPIIMKALADRMSRGELVIVDGRHADADDVRVYKSLAESNRYRAYVVDFTKVPKAECVKRLSGLLNTASPTDNSTTSGFSPRSAFDDETAIDKFYSICDHKEIPSYFKVLSPDEAMEMIYTSDPYDLTEYNAVNFIGDVHGCYTALRELLEEIGCENGVLRDDEFYIFCGDYTDRGLENAETLEFLMESAELPNTMMLEGNHERHVNDWAHGEEPRSRTFRKKTSQELEGAEVDKKMASRFFRRLIPCAWVRVPGKTSDGDLVFACHGGIPVFPVPYLGISASQLVSGVGDYRDADDVNACWEESTGIPDGIYQVHGHRTAKDLSARPFDHVFSLEGAVETGGEIRCARFEKGSDPRTVCVANKVFDHISSETPLEDMSFEDALANLRANPMIKEKHQPMNISSFNFTRKAFVKNAWDAQTIKARGLFIDTVDNMIMARSYDKFFAIGEREDTSIDNISRSFTYPVSVYRKENGYLGIAAPLGEGKLLFASKSTMTGDFAVEFKRALVKELGSSLSRFADYLEEIDASAVFEVIIPDFDRHIIEYDRPHLVLLDIVYNDFVFDHVDYDELCSVASRFRLEVKKLDCVLDTKSQLIEWYGKVSAPGFVPDDGEQVEGYVLEDADLNMAKVKCDWYRYWKGVRGMIHDVMRRGKSSRVARLRESRPEAEDFYEWLKNYIGDWKAAGNGEDPHVIDVRRAWEEHLSENR